MAVMGVCLASTFSMRKDNTGPDLKHLFIGSEGTLGIITGVTLSLPRAGRGRHVALLAARDVGGALALADKAKRELGEALSAVEFWDANTMAHVMREHCGQDPFGQSNDVGACVLVEVAGSNPDHDMLKLEAYLEGVLEAGDGELALADDAVLAQVWRMGRVEFLCAILPN